MGYIKKEKEGEFDFDKLPEGIYFFSGQEGFVKVEVNKEGHQSWAVSYTHLTLPTIYSV